MRVIAWILGSALLALGVQAGPLIRIQTPLGAMTFELFDTLAPLTTSNFLAHLNAGDYRDTIMDEILPVDSRYAASAGWLAVTNRGKSSADFFQRISTAPLPSESLLPNAYPNFAGTLAMKIVGAPVLDPTNHVLILPTNSSPLQFVLNLGYNSQLDPYPILIGTNGVNLRVEPPNTNQYDFVTTNRVLVTNCVAVTNCVISTNLTYVTNRYQWVPNYTTFGILQLGSDAFSRLLSFTYFPRTPETNVLIPEFVLPPPILSTNFYFPVLELNRTAIEQGRFDFNQVVSWDISNLSHPQATAQRGTNGSVVISWDSWTNSVNTVQYTTNLLGFTPHHPVAVTWLTLTNLTKPPPGTNVVVDPHADRDRFYRVIIR